VSAAALVADLQARGVELLPLGDRLRFRPASAVPAELRGRAREIRGGMRRVGGRR